MKRLLTTMVLLLSYMFMMAQQVSHTVQRGETLESIAQKYQVSVDAIKQANPNTSDAFFVGMKLIIPKNTYIAVPTPSETINYSTQDVILEKGVSRPNKNYERRTTVFEIGYTASSFDDVKMSGSYGFGVTFLPWNITENLYAGLHFSPFSLNFGLVDSDFVTDIIKLGPTIGYYFTPNIFVAMPIAALCYISFKDPETGKSKTKTNWGMAWAPSIYIGKKFGIYAGPYFSMGFKGKTKIDCGFRAGLYF